MNTLFRIILLAMFPVAVAFAQNEFVVNSMLDSAQHEPRIALDGYGNYTVVWTSLRDIFLQRYDAAGNTVGGETRVNESVPGDQQGPAVAMNDLGDMVIVWSSVGNADSMYDIRGRFYPHGAGAGSEFVVNSTRANSQVHPAVAIDSSGAFAVVWESWFQDGSDRGVYGRRFTAQGLPAGDEFPVNVVTAYSQARPSVALLKTGELVVLWESWKQDQPSQAGYGVFGRLWHADGSASGGEFQVNTTTADYQWFSAVAATEEGGFVAAWCSWEQDGADGTIVAQRFDSAGGKIGGEIIVNSSTAFYQWLPRVASLPGGGFAVAWSSWKQDGDREGVYARLFDANGRSLSFETQLNQHTASFQWEPDIAVTGPRSLLAVWSSWGQTGHDYDIVGTSVELTVPEGWIDPAGYVHASGSSTTRLIVHVVDSLAVTGNQYEASLDSLGAGRAQVSVRNLATEDTVVTRFPIDRGLDVFYVTPVFEGVALEIKPEFSFALNTTGSFFANHSGSTLSFGVGSPASGTKLLAPIDAAVIWGNTDTLGDGSFAVALDTALNTSGQKKIPVPFKAWNLTDNQRIDLLVVGPFGSTKWRPGQRIVLLTPPPYRVTSTNTHAELISSTATGTTVMPGQGDTNYILTRRPIRPGEKYTFSTNKSSMLDVKEKGGRAFTLELSQNYPNPFNPVTTIQYSIPADGKVVIRVYNILGQLVATPVDGEQQAGIHRITVNGAALASGVYFYRIEYGRAAITQKMVLIK